ncbi:MAG: protein phosphatase 2C domain-containing protein [Pseudomonadales bacterium]
MKIVSATHQGLVRLNNEDAVLVDETVGWVALADGMGGLLAGEEASELAVVSVKQTMAAGGHPVRELLLSAHQRVKSHAQSKNYLGKMGTTLVVWCWQNGQPEFCHVGDSRLYAFNDGELAQLSHDHTVAQRMIDEGLVAPEDADNAPHQNVLTQALGMPGTLQPQSGSTPVAGRLLFCSDGLSDLVNDADIQSIMGLDDLEECLKLLLKSALDRGGRDNVTVALVDLD